MAQGSRTLEVAKGPFAQEQTEKCPDSCCFLFLFFLSQVKDTEVRGTRFVITGLKTGGKYRFRVIAFNAAGNGEAGEVPEVLEVNDRTGESFLVKCFKAPFPRRRELVPSLKGSIRSYIFPCSCSGS